MRGEDGVVTIVERQLDFEGAIVLQFGRATARDLVAFVEAAPSEKDDSSAVFDFGGGPRRPEGKFFPTVSTHPVKRPLKRPDRVYLLAKHQEYACVYDWEDRAS